MGIFDKFPSQRSSGSGHEALRLSRPAPPRSVKIFSHLAQMPAALPCRLRRPVFCLPSWAGNGVKALRAIHIISQCHLEILLCITRKRLTENIYGKQQAKLQLFLGRSAYIMRHTARDMPPPVSLPQQVKRRPESPQGRRHACAAGICGDARKS